MATLTNTIKKNTMKTTHYALTYILCLNGKDTYQTLRGLTKTQLKKEINNKITAFAHISVKFLVTPDWKN